MLRCIYNTYSGRVIKGMGRNLAAQKGATMSEYELIEEWHIESDESEPNPVVEKVLRDITQYQDGPSNIYIGDVLWYFYGKRMWQPKDGKEWVGKQILTYDERGEYFEND